MFCKKCGVEIMEGAKFCASCGCKINDEKIPRSMNEDGKNPSCRKEKSK